MSTQHFSESKFKSDIDIFNDAIANIDLFRLKCPQCKAQGRCKAFSSYSRMMVSIEDHTVITHWITIPRVKCISCKHTHAILPSILIPHGIYSLIFMLTVLRTYYQNKFRVQRICDTYEITHSTLYLWIGIIAPVVQNTYPDASVSAYFRRIAASPVKLPEGKEMIYKPGALKSWLQRYRDGGFDALIPKERADVGVPRKLDTASIAEIHRLTDHFPRMNATLVYHKLIEEGFIDRSEISVASIQRYFKHNDLRSARITTIRDRKAFEEEFACRMYQADTCYGPYLKVNGVLKRTYLIMFINDKTRLIERSDRKVRYPQKTVHR